MTFIPKSFTPLTELAALDLDDMDGNDDHVREEASYRQICYVRLATYVRTLSTISYQLQIDSSPIGSLITSSGDKSQGDIDISSVAVGVHVLEIPALGFTLRFVRTPDVEYLTFWLTVKAPAAVDPGNTSAGYTHAIENVTVMLHREPKSWA